MRHKYANISKFPPLHSYVYLNQISPQPQNSLTNSNCLCKEFRTIFISD